MTAGLNPVPAASTATTEGVSLTGGAKLGKNDFLKLLVVQLKHQDPLSPQKGQEFAAQLAQFSSLEQLTNINTNVKASRAFDLAMSNSSMLNLIGKNVDAPGHIFKLGEGETETLRFSLAEKAKDVTVNVFDSKGVKVASQKIGASGAGLRKFLWSGKDAKGRPLPAGTYSFGIKAENDAGKLVKAQTFAAGKVTDIIFEKTRTFATVNGKKVDVKEISKVGI